MGICWQELPEFSLENSWEFWELNSQKKKMNDPTVIKMAASAFHGMEVFLFRRWGGKNWSPVKWETVTVSYKLNGKEVNKHSCHIPLLIRLASDRQPFCNSNANTTTTIALFEELYYGKGTIERLNKVFMEVYKIRGEEMILITYISSVERPAMGKRWAAPRSPKQGWFGHWNCTHRDEIGLTVGCSISHARRNSSNCSQISPEW